MTDQLSANQGVTEPELEAKEEEPAELTPEQVFAAQRVKARGRALERAHHLADVPLRDPSAATGVLEVLNHQHLLKLMVQRELRQRYVGSKMGLLWSYINPTVRFATFYFVFGVIMGRGAVPHFAIHLFAGMVLVNYFNDTFSAGSRSILTNRGVANKMPLPRQLYPWSSMFVSLYHCGPQMVVLILACYVTGFNPDLVGVLSFLMAFAIIIPLSTAMGIMFSAIGVLYRDFVRVVQIFTNMLPFCVPMMYPYTLVAKRFGHGLGYHLYFDNPVAIAVLLMQRCFWYPTISPSDAAAANKQWGFQAGVQYNFPPHLLQTGLIMIVASFVFLMFAQAVFNRLDDRLPDRLSA